MCFHEKIQCRISDMGLLGNTKRGADRFGSTGGVGAVTKVLN